MRFGAAADLAMMRPSSLTMYIWADGVQVDGIQGEGRT